LSDPPMGMAAIQVKIRVYMSHSAFGRRPAPLPLPAHLVPGASIGCSVGMNFHRTLA